MKFNGLFLRLSYREALFWWTHACTFKWVQKTFPNRYFFDGIKRLVSAIQSFSNCQWVVRVGRWYQCLEGENIESFKTWTWSWQTSPNAGLSALNTFLSNHLAIMCKFFHSWVLQRVFYFLLLCNISFYENKQAVNEMRSNYSWMNFWCWITSGASSL